MWIDIGLFAATLISLIAGGSWGIWRIARDIGAVPTLAFVSGVGFVISISAMAWGTFPITRGKVKHPALSALFVFFILFLATCLFEGLLYGAYSLIAFLWR